MGRSLSRSLLLLVQSILDPATFAVDGKESPKTWNPTLFFHRFHFSLSKKLITARILSFSSFSNNALGVYFGGLSNQYFLSSPYKICVTLDREWRTSKHKESSKWQRCRNVNIRKGKNQKTEVAWTRSKNAIFQAAKNRNEQQTIGTIPKNIRRHLAIPTLK